MTSQWTNTGDGNVRHLIDGSGLSGTGSVLTQTHDASANAATMWHAGPNNGGLGGPVGNPPAVNTQRLEFDLGANYDLDASYFWNLNQAGNTGRGVKLFAMQVSSSTTGAFTPTGFDGASVNDHQLTQGTGTAGLGAHAVLWQMQDVRRVRVDILTDWSGLADDYVGLSEVRFLGSLTPDKGANTGTIPDNLPAGRDITFNVANRTGVVTEVTVEVTLDHPSTSNVVLQLIAPDGTIETLLYTTVRGADLNGTYIFKDNATAYLSAVSQNLSVSDIVPFGSYHPENTLTSTGAPTPTSLVGTFGGKAPNGTWKLRAIDRAAGNVGSVSSARLTLFTESRERITITPGAGDSRALDLTGGVPGGTYDLERSTDLTGWTTLQTATSSATGTATLNDPTPPIGKGFYRWRGPQ